MFLKKQIFKLYRHTMLERCDDDGTRFYYSPECFPGLCTEFYQFIATAGHQMQAYIYSYDHFIPGRLVIFEHGMGDGHRPYMKEIEQLCRHGFRVFTYDHTGCMNSGGESTNGFAQALCDLNDCISAIKTDERFMNLDLSVVGHSWGGYSAMNIAALHPDISHIVAMCGFVSVKDILDSHFYGILEPYSKMLLEYERKLHPKFVDFSAIESLSKTDSNVLLIYSEGDKKCKPIHYSILKKTLGEKSNIRFLLVKEKGHHPTYTIAAVKKLEVYAQKRRRRKKLKLLETPNQKLRFVSSFDWDSMTEQDETVWNEIICALQS